MGEENIKTEVESEPEVEPEPEPLARTRTRRSNAGARMHEMIFNADDEELFNATYSGLLKADDDSSEDEEYVPKDLGGTGGDNADDEDVNDDNSDKTSDSDSDSEDEEDSDEDLDEEQQDDEEHDNRDNFDNLNIKYVKLETKNESEPSSTTIIPGSPRKAAFEACKKICSVCLSDQSDEDDEIIECDSCGVSVHESCYGVLGESNSHVDHQETKDSNNHESANHSKGDDQISVCSNISSESTEPWFCEPCKRSVKNLFCELCPNTGGIFKQTDTGKWVHMVCALYTRGITFENIDSLSNISLFEINYALFGSKACTICEDRRLARTGICIGCDAGLCKTFFHVTCAQKEGLLFESHSDEVDPYFAQCKQHADKTVIRKKKRTYMALFARLKRVVPMENCSERIKSKLAEINKKVNPNLTRWTPENRPPLPIKVSKSLLTSPSLIKRLDHKSELLGLDPTSAFMSVLDEMEMARQKWHIPPAFNLEFVAYCRDRTTRMVLMKKQNDELVKQNFRLKTDEANLREKFNSIKDLTSKLKSESEGLIKEARSIQKIVATTTGKQFNLPIQLEQFIARFSNPKNKTSSKSSNKSKPTSSLNVTNNKTSSTYCCGKCGTVKDQHLLALCDTCHKYIHIYCLDPPLSRVPKKNKFGGWQCSDCSEKEEEDLEEALEEQNSLALQEAAQDGPRRLRERIKYPEKYCQESMMMADFWSVNPKRKSKKSSKKSNKPKKVKVE